MPRIKDPLADIWGRRSNSCSRGEFGREAGPECLISVPNTPGAFDQLITADRADAGRPKASNVDQNGRDARNTS